MNVLEIKNIEKYYGSKSSLTKAIDDISFNVDKYGVEKTANNIIEIIKNN